MEGKDWLFRYDEIIESQEKCWIDCILIFTPWTFYRLRMVPLYTYEILGKLRVQSTALTSSAITMAFPYIASINKHDIIWFETISQSNPIETCINLFSYG